MPEKKRKFDLTVYIETRPNLRDNGLEMEMYLGRGILDSIFDKMEEINDEEVTFSFPERWLNILEQRDLYNRLEKYGSKLKKVTIITHSPYIIQTIPHQSVKIFDDPNKIKEGDIGKLYNEPHIRFINPNGLNILGR